MDVFLYTKTKTIIFKLVYYYFTSINLNNTLISIY